MAKYVNVLGTKYEIIRVTADEITEGYGGFCDPDLHTIKVIRLETSADWKEESAAKRMAREKLILRHEIVHAFLNESGLKDNCAIPQFSWANNEEMVDWIAAQGPKIFEAWQKAGAV